MQTRLQNQNLILTLLLCIYLISRLMGLFYFAPHTDESVYTQVSMMIAEDWEKNKYFSLDGRWYNDYKQPLKFWITSLSINLWKSPLVGTRIWSLLFGFSGIFFTQLLISRVCDKTTAMCITGLIVLSEYYLYFDSIGIHEVVLYGSGAAFLYYLYDFLEKNRWISCLLAIFTLTAVLTTKASGVMWIVLGLTLPLLILASKTTNEIEEEESCRVSLVNTISTLKRHIVGLYVKAFGILGAAEGIHYIIIPSEFDNIKKNSHQSGMIRNIGEILDFPVSNWIENLKFYWDSVILSEFSYTAIPVILLIISAPFVLFFKQREWFWRYLVLWVLFLISFVPILIVAKASFLRLFGVGLYFLYMLLAPILVLIYKHSSPSFQKGILLLIIPALIGWKITDTYRPLLQWNQTDLALKEGGGWGNGIGTATMIDHLAKLEPGFLLGGPYWGHPWTTIQIFHRYYPQLKLVYMSQETMDHLNELHQLTTKNKLNLYFAMVHHNFPWIESILNDPQLCADKTVLQKIYRNHVLSIEPFVICRVKKYKPPTITPDQYKQSIKDLTKKIEQYPNYIPGYFQRGQLYAALKHYEKAVDDLTKVINSDYISSNKQKNYFKKLETNDPIGFNQHDQQLKTLTKTNTFQKSYLIRGNVYIGLQQYHQAIADLTSALVFEPNSAIIYNNRGFAYKNLQQYKKAFTDFSKAIELDPQFHRSYAHRGSILMDLGNREGACKDWKRACALKDCQNYNDAAEKGICPTAL
ncbi:MAG: tetratricopeptide repeat protein [SAR324 cluster bacterium]|nr:tetratricopeptide repeat protein [SAR324 cluster bacterium]